MKARGNRDSIVVATKVRGEMWKGDDGEGLSRSHIERAVEDSLRRLQVDTIDLYQCHWPGRQHADRGDAHGLRRADHAPARCATSAPRTTPPRSSRERSQSAAGKSLPRFASLQPHHNLVHRNEYEAELAALCEREKASASSPTARSPAASSPASTAAASRCRRASAPTRVPQQYMTDDGFAVVDALDAVADSRTTPPSPPSRSPGRSPDRPSPRRSSAPTRREQLAALLPASDLTLTPDEIAALDTVSASF